MLVPTHRRSESTSKEQSEPQAQATAAEKKAGGEVESPKEADPMDDLVAQLEQMESSKQ